MCAFTDITAMVSETEVSSEQTKDTEPVTVDGELIASLQCGNVVELKDNGRMMFILMIDRDAGTFTGTPVELSERKNSVRTIPSKNELVDKKLVKVKKNPEFICTDRIETVSLDMVSQIRGRGPVSPTAHLDVINKILENFDYAGVGKKYDDMTDDMTYDSFVKDMKLQKVDIKTTADPQTRLITVLQKRLSEAKSEISNIKSYKESAKKELTILKKDNSCLKRDCETAKATAEKCLKEKEEAEIKAREALAVGEKYDELASKYNEVLKTNSDLESLLSSKKDAEKDLAELKTKLLDAEAALNSKDKEIGALNDEITRLATIESHYEGLKEDYSAIQSKYDKLMLSINEDECSGVKRKPDSYYEYLLSDANSMTNNSFVMFPSAAEVRLSALLDNVPDEFKPEFLLKMVEHFEQGLRDKTIVMKVMHTLEF